MLKIDDSVKTAFLTDSTPKELEVKFKQPLTYKNRYKYEVNWWPKISEGLLNPGDKRNIMANTTNGGFATSNWFGDMVADVNNIFDFKYIVISFMLDIDLDDDSKPYPSTIDLELHVYELYGYRILTQTQTLYVADHIQDSETERVMFYVPTSALLEKNFAAEFLIILPSNEIALNGKIYYNKPLIHVGDDPSLFPYPYKPYNEFDIDTHPEVIISNDHLLTESFSLNESLCSEHNIKFGLCESAYCQFTVTDDNNDYKNKEIRPYIKLSDEDCMDIAAKQVNLYTSSHVPYNGQTYSEYWNNFKLNLRSYLSTVDMLNLNGSTKELLPQYNFLRIQFEFKIGSISMPSGSNIPSYILFYPAVYLEGQAEDHSRFWTAFWPDDIPFSMARNTVISVQDALSGFVKVTVDAPIEYCKYYNQFGEKYSSVLKSYGEANSKIGDLRNIYFYFLDENYNTYSDPNEKITRIDTKERYFQINFINSKADTTPAYNIDDCIQDDSTIQERSTLYSEESKIPLGVFTVNNVKKNHVNDILKQEITAYDKLTALEQNAANWYTQYMFGIDFMDYTGSTGFQFARQMYSTFYNYLHSLKVFEGYTTDPYNNTSDSEYGFDLLWEESLTPGLDRAGTPKVLWAIDNTTNYPRHTNCNINYISHTETNPDTSKLYFIHIDYPLYPDINNIKSQFEYPLYDDFGYSNFDPLYRGLYKGNVLVEQTLSDDTTKNVCVDSDDYFVLDPSCTQFTVHVAVCIQGYIQGVYDSGYVWHAYTYVNKVSLGVTKASLAPDLPNGAMRLVYYNYGKKDIFACDSSITGRDVVRSLLEVCGCFFRLNRYTGKPEFVYCTKAGLYPRDDLYPADDLYPREGTDYTITMGKYQSFIQEDYTVQKYGKIQIRKNVTSNETKSIVEWEYTGDDSYDNVYAIDDNIFYCNDKMEYDYDNMPEVHNMLVNMWARISNMDYVPTSLVCKGMPWIECGDRIGVLTKTGGAETFIFHRTLTGIQSLKDNYESEGDEYTEAINDYGYKEWEDN